jgi:type III pantothenate kinase
MTSLVIDIGNTYTKIAVFNRYELLHNEQYKAIDAALIIKLMNDYPVNKAIISSVKKKDIEAWQNILAQEVELFYFDATMAKGIVNHYLTPETLGLDRLQGRMLYIPARIAW